MTEMPSEEIAKWVQSKVPSNSDGVFISCTCFPAMGAVEQLEETLSIPVITSNQATVWQLLKLAGYTHPVTGYGELLQRF